MQPYGSRAIALPRFSVAFPVASPFGEIESAFTFERTAKMGSRPELKVEDEVGFIKFFRNLPDKGEDSLRIFDRGDFYSAHGADADFIARTVGMRVLLSDTSLTIE